MTEPEETSAKGIAFTLPGTPVAQGRPRLTARGGHARAYDPPKSRDWKAYAVACIHEQLLACGVSPGELVYGSAVPLILEVVAVWPRPKGAPKTKRLERQPRTSKPDGSNVLKIVEDAITASGLWHDDSQIVRARITKWTGALDEAPGVYVHVRPFPM